MTKPSGRLGIGLVGIGLVVQLGTGFLWSPGSFILSAALGLPLVLIGAFLTWRSLPKVTRSSDRDAPV